MADAIEEPVAVAAVEDDAEPEDLLAALQQVIKKARFHGGLCRGLRETVKALDKKVAHLCVLAEDCDEPAYTALIDALCTEHGIDIIRVPERAALGQWVGLEKLDKANNVKKTIKTSVCCITDYGEKSKALDMLTEHLKRN